MANSNSPASKKARQRSADARQQRIVARGGKQKRTLLSPEAHDALKKLAEASGESETAMINKAILSLYEKYFGA